MKTISVVQWFRNMVAPSAPASGATIYALANQLRVKQAGGLDFALEPVVAPIGAVYDGGSPTSTYTGAAKVDFGGVT